MDDSKGQDRPIAHIGQVGSEIDTEVARSLLFLIHTNCAPPKLSGGESGGEIALGVEKLRKHLERVFGRLASNDSFAKWIEQKHPVEFVRARRLAVCSSVLEYGVRGDSPAMVSNRCMERYLCSQCAALNAASNLARAAPRVQNRLDECRHVVPAMLTVTIKNEACLASMMEKFDRFLAAMLKQRRQWNEKGRKRFSQKPALAYFDGGIFSFEAKRGDGSGLWHLHAHAVVLVHPSDLVYSESIFERREGEACAAFIRDWSSSVGYYPQIDLQALRVKDGGVGVASGLVEVFKYCFKAGGLPFEDRFSVHAQMQGRRVIRPFGSLIRLVSPEQIKPAFEPRVEMRRTSRGFVGREVGGESWVGVAFR